APLFVEAPSRGDAKALEQILLRLDLGSAARHRPRIAIRAPADAKCELQRLHEVIRARGKRLANPHVRVVFLRLDPLSEDDASIRIRLESVDDLRGVNELRGKVRRPGLRPRPLETVDAERMPRSNRIAPREAARRVLERAKTRGAVIHALHAVAHEIP